MSKTQSPLPKLQKQHDKAEIVTLEDGRVVGFIAKDQGLPVDRVFGADYWFCYDLNGKHFGGSSPKSRAAKSVRRRSTE